MPPSPLGRRRCRSCALAASEVSSTPRALNPKACAWGTTAGTSGRLWMWCSKAHATHSPPTLFRRAKGRTPHRSERPRKWKKGSIAPGLQIHRASGNVSAISVVLPTFVSP